MARTKSTAAAAVLAPPRPTLVFRPVVWRTELEHQLINAGIEHDLAGIVARRTVQGLVARVTEPDYTPHQPEELY